MTTHPALLGATAGIATAALAIAAHGAAGGAVPAGPAATLLVAVAVGVGVLGAHLPTLPPVALLAAGQIGSHLALTAVTDEHAHTSATMLAGHTVAVLGCALLLGAAQRLIAACSRAARGVLSRRPGVAAPAVLRPRGDRVAYPRRPAASTISRRGPPAVPVAGS